MSRNPYHIEGQEPTLRQSVFVFMDILGYREMIRQSEESGTQEQALRELHRALVDGRAWLEEKNVSPELRGLFDKDSYALKAFTDNIVIGWPVHDDAESEMGRAFEKLAIFQLQMAIEGFFIRGAISVGEAYVDEMAVFGAALSEAYNGESTLARDPRIILTFSAVDAVRKHLAYYGPPRDAPHVRDVLCDSDSQWFLNYLDCLFFADDDHVLHEKLSRHRAAVEGKLMEHGGNPPVWSKYTWVADYHNHFCDLHSHRSTKQHKVNVELFRASPTPIVE